MIIGHQKIISFLTSSIRSGRLAHAYLFIGPPQVGKKTVALEFIKKLQCEKSLIKNDDFSACGQCRSCLLIKKNQHPDVLLVEIGNKVTETEGEANQSIKIEQIRQIQHLLSLSPFSAKYKAVIIDEADRLTLEAANCLLKTLEEPSQKSLLILISANWQRILPTIISRCQLIKFLSVKSQLIKEDLKALGFRNNDRIEQAVKFSCGRPGAAIKLLSEPELLVGREQSVGELQKLLKKDLVEKFKYAQQLAQDSAGAQEVLGQWLIWFRDQLLMMVGAKNLTVFGQDINLGGYSLLKIQELIKNIQQTQGLLNESSFNTRLILENLMLKI